MLFLQILRIHVYLAQDPNRTEKTRDFLRTLNQMRFAESVYDIHPDLAHGNSFLSDFNSSYEGMRKKLVEELFNPLMYGICFLRADYESQKLRLPRFTLPRDLHSGQKEINSYRTHTVERAMFFYTELLRVLEQDKARLPSLMEAKIIDGLRADFALSTMPQRISTISTSYPYLRPQPSAPFAEPGVVLGVAVAVAEEIPSEYVVQGLPAPSAPPHDKMPPPGASPPGVLYHLDVPGPSRKSGGSRDPSPKSITFSCSPPGVSYSDPTPREKTSKQHVGNPGDSGGLFTHSKQPADELSSPSRSGKARDRALKPESSSDFACATPQGRTNFT
jgi:hypothetical protein